MLRDLQYQFLAVLVGREGIEDGGELFGIEFL